MTCPACDQEIETVTENGHEYFPVHMVSDWEKCAMSDMSANIPPDLVRRALGLDP